MNASRFHAIAARQPRATPMELLAMIRGIGFHVSASGADELRLASDIEDATPELLALVEAHKPALLGLLRAEAKP